MNSPEKDQCWLIVRPRYSLACADLSVQPIAEQLSFEYTVYHLISGRAQLRMDDNCSYIIEPPGFAFILPGKGYKIESATDQAGTDRARALSIRIKRETI